MGSTPLIGNRLALVGAVLYLLEWVAIAFIADVPTDKLGDDAASIVGAYSGEARSTALAAGWFSVVLLGRILFVVAVRKAFRDSGRDSALLDFAVGAMTVSVSIEIVSFALTPAAAWLAENDAAPDTIVALDSASSIAFLMVFGPIGVSVLAMSAAIVRSQLFARWVGWLGVAAGALAIAGGILAAAALGDDGSFKDWGEQPSAVGALAFWIWMLATAVILWRRTPRGVV